MKFKIKQIGLAAGRPVAFLLKKTAKKLNVHTGDRVEISTNGKKIIAVVDTIKSLLNENDIALSDEALSYLNVKPGHELEFSLLLPPKSSRSILKKLQGKELTKEEIHEIIQDIVNNYLTEAEIAYFVSGVYEHGMSFQETVNLTEAMYKTGDILHWHTNKIVDKHSIGGIAGSRTTPILVSICAALGIVMPKTSSRAITSAAGTADVMETITKVDFSSNELRRIVKKTNACLAWGGSLGLSPADDKLIRVERLLNLDPESQLIASILSKKLAVGSKYVLIDIPYGPEAKVNLKEAENLKKKFIKVANHFNLHLRVVFTKGDEPIGNGIGPLLEMKDVISVLKREADRPLDLENKAVFLASQILEMTGKAKKGESEKLARETLDSKKALRKFEEIIETQGRKTLPDLARYRYCIKSNRSGKIISIHNKMINNIGRILGCPVDHSSGIYIHKHNHSKVSKGDILLTLYAESSNKLKAAIKFLNSNKVIEIN